MTRLLLSVGRRVRMRHFRTALDAVGSPRSVLDAGCGDGQVAIAVASQFPLADVLACDIDESSLIEARRAVSRFPSIELRKAVVGGPNLGRRFDLAICVDVLEHIPDAQAAFRWLAAHLEPGGSLIAHVPARGQRHWLRSVAQAMEAELAAGHGPHVREGFSSQELRALAVDSGLDVACLESTFHSSLTQAAADLDTWTYLRRARWIKAILLPLLLGLGSFERSPSDRPGNGLLLIARAPSC